MKSIYILVICFEYTEKSNKMQMSICRPEKMVDYYHYSLCLNLSLKAVFCQQDDIVGLDRYL